MQSNGNSARCNSLLFTDVANEFRIANRVHVAQMTIQNVLPRESLMALMTLETSLFIFQMAQLMRSQCSLLMEFLRALDTTANDKIITF